MAGKTLLTVGLDVKGGVNVECTDAGRTIGALTYHIARSFAKGDRKPLDILLSVAAQLTLMDASGNFEESFIDNYRRGVILAREKTKRNGKESN